MSKFAKSGAPRVARRATTPIQTTDERSVTHEGGEAYVRDAKSELFLLAVTNFVAEDTFYESGNDRDERFERLIHAVTKADPAWMRMFIPFLRNKANMRSASIVAAAEYVAAGGKNGRQVVDSAIQRADEPAEMLAYALNKFGRFPVKPIKRGIADAAERLYNERNVLKYDGSARPMRFADVIEMVHPRPHGKQSVLFKYLLDKRHERTDAIPSVTELQTLHADMVLRNAAPDERRALLGGAAWNQAHWSWERLSGWLPGGMDAQAWESVIPSMGYMALLRNLRNFDEAGISAFARKVVIDKLTNPAEVAASRQFPYRFMSAYKELATLHWGVALEQALDLACKNVPELKGSTLVLIDVSGSMGATVSQHSKMSRWEIGAVFGAALAKRTQQVDVALFGTTNAACPIKPTDSVLRYVERVKGIFEAGRLGWGTHTWHAVRDHYKNHDRVVIFTDEQTHDYAGSAANIPLIYTFNLAGYAPAMMPNGPTGRYALGGFNDQTFKLMEMLEARESCNWEQLFAL